MTKLRNSTKQSIAAAIAAGTQPQKAKTNEGLVLVRAGTKSRIKLVGDDGKPTSAGLYWQSQGGEPLAEAGFMQQTPFREGNREFIRLRGGAKAMVRRWNAAGEEFEFTKLGLRFYETLRRNFVVHVPTNIRLTRKNGSTYWRKSSMPIERLGLRPVELPLNLTDTERYQRVKDTVANQLPASGVLDERYDETWTVDWGSDQWLIDEEVVGTNPETQEGETHVILDRRVGEMRFESNLLRPEWLCAEALKEVDDKLCGPRQMGALLSTDMGYIIEDLEPIGAQLYGEGFEMEESGCTPRMILEYCRARGLRCTCIHNERCIEQVAGDPESQHLVFAVHEDHVFFYRRAYLGLQGLDASCDDEVKLKVLRQAPEEIPPVSEWQAWSEEPAAGHFWTGASQLEDVRRWFLERGRSPKITMKGLAGVSKLVYHCRKNEGGGKCVIHGLPEDWDVHEAWLKRLDLGIEYTGANLPTLALTVLNALLKRSRLRFYPPAAVQTALLEEFEGCCAECGSAENLEWDHVSRFSEGFGEQLFQPLCHDCHRTKTEQECHLYDDEVLPSFFEEEVWRQYVLSPRQPPLVFKNKPDEHKLREDFVSQSALHANELPKQWEIADVIRCRKRALEFCRHPLPIFSPLDDIRPLSDHTLGDLNFVTRPYKHFVEQLGYTGPGWQHRVQTEFLLHMDVIGWADISHTLTASAHYPANLLAEPLRIMEEAWEGDRDRAKFAVNSLIGLWCLDEASRLTVTTSRREDDAPAKCLKRRLLYPGGCIYDFIVQRPLATNASCRPLHDLCLGTEATRVGQMIYALKRAKAVPYQFKTDSILYKLPAGNKKKPHLDQIRFKDLHKLRERCEPIVAGQKKSCEMAVVDSEEAPFRVNRARVDDLMRSDPELPSRRCDPATG